MIHQTFKVVIFVEKKNKKIKVKVGERKKKESKLRDTRQSEEEEAP